MIAALHWDYHSANKCFLTLSCCADQREVNCLFMGTITTTMRAFYKTWSKTNIILQTFFKSQN